MKRIVTIVILNALVICALAQVNFGGKPYIFSNKIKTVKTIKSQNIKILLPPIDLKKLQEEDITDESNGIPPRFGFPFKVNLDLTNSGEWAELENGDRIWNLEIQCPSAKSINLLYDRFWIPEEGRFYIYNSNKTDYIGGFTKYNNKGTRTNPGKFGTGLVYGDKIILVS